jgi:CMP-N,N'-diacetyllegionaminic acid synthase
VSPCWGLIPARGGSKSIPLKNLAALSGRPLLDYVVLAAQTWGGLQRIICSTDSAPIAERARKLGIEVDARPPQLGGDDVAVADVAREFITRASPDAANRPDWLFLLQPTSPFLLPEHLAALSERIGANPQANSAQTVVPVPHNHHAWNQRVFRDGEVGFAFAAERARAYNKQLKPHYFVFGNLVAVRTKALLAGGDFFAVPSVGVGIEKPYDLDIDTADDLKLAEALLASGCVGLRHLSK